MGGQESIVGRVALVTGGGRGIGRAIALALARAGAHVAVAARTVPEIEAVAAEIAALGRKTFFLPLDVADRAQLARVPEAMARDLGPPDILVNNAGLHFSGPVQRTDDAAWDAVLAVDLTAPFLLSRACLPAMYERRHQAGIEISAASRGAARRQLNPDDLCSDDRRLAAVILMNDQESQRKQRQHS